MGCFNETTSVKINKQKKDLAKSKGLKLQDLLDHALDEALGFSYYPMSELRLLEIDNEIESLKIQKEKAMRDCQKKIDILISDGVFRDMEGIWDAYMYYTSLNGRILTIQLIYD